MHGYIAWVQRRYVTVVVMHMALLVAGCTGTTMPSPPSSGSQSPVVSAPSTPPASTPGGESAAAPRCPALSVPTAPVVACTELRDGVETYSDQAPRSIAHVDYYVIGECVGSGDLDEVPYTVTVDNKVVTSASLTCRTALITKNSAFSGVSGQHRLTIRFAEGIGAHGSGYALVTTG